MESYFSVNELSNISKIKYALVRFQVFMYCVLVVKIQYKNHTPSPPPNWNDTKDMRKDRADKKDLIFVK